MFPLPANKALQLPWHSAFQSNSGRVWHFHYQREHPVIEEEQSLPVEYLACFMIGPTGRTESQSSMRAEFGLEEND